MHVWIILVLVFFRSMSASLANISRIVMAEGLESLPEDLLAEIGSRVNSVPNYVQKVVNGDDAGILSSVLYDRFGWQECLIAALLIEEAPGGVVVQVITNFLQYDNQIPSGAMENALEIAYTSGHCPKIIKMLSDRLPTSRALPPGCEKARDIYDCVMSADNSCRSSVHLSDLLKMHALPRNTFMDVLAAKYSNDLGSFFNDCKRCGGIPSITMMSHAVHIYRLLNGVRDFEPIPYARILSNGSIPNAIIETNLPLDYEGHSGLEVYRRHIHFPVLHNLQIVLSPSSEINFFTNMSREGRIKFLFEACTSGRLDWVQYVLCHMCSTASHSCECVTGQVHGQQRVVERCRVDCIRFHRFSN